MTVIADKSFDTASAEAVAFVAVDAAVVDDCVDVIAGDSVLGAIVAIVVGRGLSGERKLRRFRKG